MIIKESRKQSRVMITRVICTIIILFVIYVLRSDIKITVNKVFSPSVPQSINLSLENKIEDFECFYSTVTGSMPMIDNYQQVYGFSFRDRKEYYEDLIRNTNSDFEFYCAMDAIIEDIPSFHTSLIFPESYDTLNCYNQKEIITDRKVIGCSEYWKNILEQKKNEDSSQYYSFLYTDGEYKYSCEESSGEDDYSGYRVEKINNQSADDYIKNAVSVFSLYYDGTNKKPCRTRILFNNKSGVKCDISLMSEDGQKKNVSLYMDICSEELFLLKYDDRIAPGAEHKDVESCEGENTLYVKINSMGLYNAKEVKEVLHGTKCNNVILDLRENYGGNNQFAEKNIYPELFSEDISENHDFYIPCTDANKKFAGKLAYKIVNKIKKSESNPFNNDIKMLRGVKKNEYEGGISKNKNVVILTSQHTGSAADTFVSDMKKNGLAYIIGNNTGGEGLMYSFSQMKLPNSCLTYIYMPGGAVDFENADNSVYGTSPDLYVDTNPSVCEYYENNSVLEYDRLCEEDAAVKRADEYLREEK